MNIFNSIGKELDAYDARREQIIKASRVILKDAKRTIFLCHEGKLDEAEKLLTASARESERLEKSFSKPLNGAKGTFDPYREGTWNACMEEFLEAWFFYALLKKKSIQLPAGRRVPAQVIVGALSDVTGELTRVAVMQASDKNIKEVSSYRNTVAKIVEHMLPLHLTGQNRQKFDHAKRNLKRIEEVLYEVKIRQ